MAHFSVLVANYNNGRFLHEAIQSVVLQTYKNWEIVIVDDGSTDGSLAVVEGLMDAGINIKLFKHNTKLGVGATKADCIAFSTGEIAGFLDPDDALTSDAIEVMVKAHQQYPACSLVYSRFYYCDTKLKITHRADWVKPIPTRGTNLLYDQAMAFVTFKRQAYNKTEGIGRHYLAAEDKDLYYKLEEVAPLVFIDEVLYLYRENPYGLSQFENYKTAQDFHLKVIECTMERRKKNGSPSITPMQYRKVKSRIFLQRGELLVKLHSPTREVIKWLCASFLQQPFLYNHLRLKYFFQSWLS